MTEITEFVCPPRRERRRWPATILAANRTAKAPGRIRFLTVSITTIRAISAPGVPGGTRCVNIWLYWKIHDQTIPPNQRGKAKATVYLRWLEPVKTYGKRPIKFEQRIKKNKAIKMEIEPGGVLSPKIASISKERPFKIFTNIICIWDFTSQNKEGKKNKIRITLIQFKE